VFDDSCLRTRADVADVTAASSTGMTHESWGDDARVALWVGTPRPDKVVVVVDDSHVVPYRSHRTASQARFRRRTRNRGRYFLGVWVGYARSGADGARSYANAVECGYTKGFE